MVKKVKQKDKKRSGDKGHSLFGFVFLKNDCLRTSLVVQW